MIIQTVKSLTSKGSPLEETRNAEAIEFDIVGLRRHGKAVPKPRTRAEGAPLGEVA